MSFLLLTFLAISVASFTSIVALIQYEKAVDDAYNHYGMK